MRKLKIALCASGIVLLASAGQAAFDQPDGSPPFGLEFGGNSSGQQLNGHIAVVFRDADVATAQAPAFDSVVSLGKGGQGAGAGESKGGDRHVFYTEYDCAVDSPQAGAPPLSPACDSLCFDDGSGQLVMSLGQVRAIQLCIQDQLAPSVVTKFGLPASTLVRLKDVTGFVSEPDPPSRWLVGAQLVVTLD